MSTELNNIQNFYSGTQTDLDNISYEMLSSSRQTFNKDGREIDGIEILYNMARAGKINPWDIDLSDLADKYFLEITELKKTVDLKHMGRTIVFLSILLRLKSNVLDGIEIDEIFNEPQDIQDEFYDDYEPEYEDEQPVNRNNVISIDEVLQRRTSVRQNNKRVVTLNDLIRQLKFYEELERKIELQNKLKRQRKRISSYARFSARDISDMYSEDYIKTAIPKMKENLDRIFKNEKKIELETLTLLGFSKTTAYLALLFLVADTDYDITQEKFYEKLYVEKYNKNEQEKQELAETAV